MRSLTEDEDEFVPRITPLHHDGSFKRAPEPAPVAWPVRDEEAFARGKVLLQTLQCDALSFTSDDLMHLVLEIFQEVSKLFPTLDNLSSIPGMLLFACPPSHGYPRRL